MHRPNSTDTAASLEGPFHLFRTIVDTWLAREVSQGLAKRRQELQSFCTEIAERLFLTRARALAADEVERLARWRDIDLGKNGDSGPSLLRRRQDGSWSFVHRSVGEFLIIQRLASKEHPHTLPGDRAWTPQMRAFARDLLRTPGARYLSGARLGRKDLHGIPGRGLELPAARLPRLSFAGRDLRGIVLDHADLRGCNFVGADLGDASLRHANLEGARLVRTNLVGTSLESARLVAQDLSGQNLSKTTLRSANLTNASLRNADLRGQDLGRAQLSGADLSGALLDGVSLQEADLSGQNLSRHVLPGVNLGGANLTRANLSGSHLEGIVLTRANLAESTFAGACLRGADLSGGTRLKNTDFSGADLGAANLSSAVLSRVSLRGAKLIRANLAGAFLLDVDLSGADLRGADLAGGSLIAVNLTGATHDGRQLERLARHVDGEAAKHCEIPVQIRNRLGLHARASARLIQLVYKFQSEVMLVSDHGAGNARNIMGMLTLVLACGAPATVVAYGQDADLAARAVADYIESGLGDGLAE